MKKQRNVENKAYVLMKGEILPIHREAYLKLRQLGYDSVTVLYESTDENVKVETKEMVESYNLLYQEICLKESTTFFTGSILIKDELGQISVYNPENHFTNVPFRVQEELDIPKYKQNIRIEDAPMFQRQQKRSQKQKMKKIRCDKKRRI